MALRDLHAAGVHDRRVGLQPNLAKAQQRRSLMEARWLTVGPVQENTWIARQDGADKALLIDPGDEPEKLLEALEELGATLEAILITHCHFDHVGAVKAMADATGAPVYCPAGEVFMLEDIKLVRVPGLGPFETYTPEHTVKDGDKLQLAGLRDRRHRHARPQPGPRDLLDRRPRRRSSPATCSSRARSAAPTCPAATTTTLMRSHRDAAGHAARRDRRAPGPHGPDDARPRARAPTRSCASSPAGEQVPGAARHVRRAARPRGRTRPAGSDRGEDPRARRLRPDRDADVRGHAAVQPHGGARRPTSSRRRCTPSRTTQGTA